jgi:hypothetical protein
MYKIINPFELFTNPYSDPGWQVWRIDPVGNFPWPDLIGVFRTRAEARIAVAELREV